MQIEIKRIDLTLPLPSCQSSGAVGFDLYSRIDEMIPPGETKLIPTNVIIATPPGYMLLVASRSSLAKKKGLNMANNLGIIDPDYCGDTDEIHVLLYNFGKAEVPIARGERLAQGIFVKIEKAEWNEVQTMNEPSRGGFGSTGKF